MVSLMPHVAYWHCGYIILSLSGWHSSPCSNYYQEYIIILLLVYTLYNASMHDVAWGIYVPHNYMLMLSIYIDAWLYANMRGHLFITPSPLPTFRLRVVQTGASWKVMEKQRDLLDLHFSRDAHFRRWMLTFMPSTTSSMMWWEE